MQKMKTTSTANPSELVHGPSPFSSPGYLEASIFQESDKLTNTDKSMTQTSHNQYISSTTLSSRTTSPESKNLKYDITGHGSNELIHMPSNISVEDPLGPSRDGRLRNPVPRNLKGKTSSKQGNFGVMHMDMNNGNNDDPNIKNAAAENDLAARKTIKVTGCLAKATKPGQHVTPKKQKSKGAFDNSESNYESSPVVSQEDCTPELAPGDTKIEQARLLTLLRSVNPITVVDQLCKAVAYFGGIPGAPPPEDGIFPKSFITKETGALFIGWVAEIFPDLSLRYSKTSKEIPLTSESSTKDFLTENCNGAIRGDSFSNELPNPRNDYGFGPAFSGYPWALSLNESLIAGNTKLIEQRLKSPSIKEHAEETSLTLTRKRKRGRPKGSRNKKFLGPQSSENSEKSALNFDPPEINLTASEILNISSEVAANQFNRSYHDFFREKNFSQADLIHNQPHKDRKSLGIDSQIKNCRPKLNQSLSTDFEFNSEDRAVLEVIRSHGTETKNTKKSSEQDFLESYSDTKVQELSQSRKLQALVPITVHEPTQNVVPSASAINGILSSSMIDSSFSRSPEIPQGSLNTSKTDNSLDNTKNRIKWLSTNDKSNLSVSSTKAPQPGNPEYHNAGKNVARYPSNSEERDAIPSISQIPRAENKIMPSRNDTPISPLSHSELKNHYEQLSNLHQFQTRSDIPTSLLQQQTLQNSKCSSSSDQHASPLTTQQKTTKNNQIKSHHNEISTPESLNRPTPALFYNQRPQTSMVNTSYPQPSAQGYSGNQASPQINHGTYQNSSYFTQPKLQLSSESNIGTLSPYNVSQSSPSHFHNEDTYRTTISQKMKNSKSFSNTENDHRNSNTHSVAQQIQFFPNSRTKNISQSTQNAYGQLNEASFIDLPTLDSLVHANKSNNSNLITSNCGYGQNLGVNIGTSRAMMGSNHLYGGVNLNPYETNTNHFLRAVVPHNSHNSNSTLYTNPSPGLNDSSDVSATNNAKDRLMRSSERYR